MSKILGFHSTTEIWKKQYSLAKWRIDDEPSSRWHNTEWIACFEQPPWHHSIIPEPSDRLYFKKYVDSYKLYVIAPRIHYWVNSRWVYQSIAWYKTSIKTLIDEQMYLFNCGIDDLMIATKTSSTGTIVSVGKIESKNIWLLLFALYGMQMESLSDDKRHKVHFIFLTSEIAPLQDMTILWLLMLMAHW